MNYAELISPTELSAADRAAEIAAILAIAIVRGQLPESPAQIAPQRQIGLGFLPGQSVHPTPYRAEPL